MIIGILSSAVETALMVLEPAYRTYKELKVADNAADGEGSNAARDPGERRRLLVHWVVYAAFRAVDCVARPVLPMYNVLSLAAVVWLRAGGTDTVYQTLIRPFLADSEATVDQWFDGFERARNAVAMTAAGLGAAAATAVIDQNDAEPLT